MFSSAEGSFEWRTDSRHCSTFGGHWKVHREGCTHIWLAGHLDRAIVTSDDVQYHGGAKPGSTHRVGGEKRFKYAPKSRGLHAMSRIGNAEPSVLSRTQFSRYGRQL